MRNIFLQTELTFIAPLVFVIIFLISFLVGFLNGTRPSLYFLGLNIFALGISLVFINSFMDKIIDWGMSRYSFGKIKLTDIYGKWSSMSEPITALLLLLIFMLLFNLMFFAIYFIFRKKLKSKIRKNIQNRNSNLLRRAYGGSIALITAVPFAVLIASPLTTLGDHNVFVDFLSKVVRFISFNTIKDVNNNSRELVDNVLIMKTLAVDNEILQNMLGRGFDPEALKTSFDKEEVRESFGKLLKSKNLGNSLDLIKDQLGSKKVDFGKMTTEITTKGTKFTRVDLTPDETTSAAKKIAEAFNSKVNTVQTWLSKFVK